MSNWNMKGCLNFDLSNRRKSGPKDARKDDAGQGPRKGPISKFVPKDKMVSNNDDGKDSGE